jgi:hypothetical protein
MRATGTFSWGQLIHLVESNWYIFKIPITAVEGNWSTPEFFRIISRQNY